MLLWPDTFTNHFHPHVGQAAVQVLEDAGWQVQIPSGPLCCGLTWISTGQLSMAERVLGRTVTQLAGVHCHQHAVLGWDADAQLLTAAGAKAEHLASRCCGLAGNFGFQSGHAQVSEALAEQVLLPRQRDADPAAVVLADGFSCRTQIHELDSGSREAMHLAELLAAASGGLPREHAEGQAAPRPAAPSRAGKLAATAGVLAGAAAAAAAIWGTRR